MKEVTAPTPEKAAEFFASYAFGNYDMWEHSNVWKEGWSIIITDLEGTCTTFEIIVESIPSFYCKEIKK